MNAMTQEYSYVLTARHAIVAEAVRNMVVDHNGHKIEVLDVLVFPKVGQEEPLDCAILKITHQAGLSQKTWNASHLPQEANLTLVGLPETERTSATPIKQWIGHSASVANELIILALRGIPPKDVIQGMSGGGVYHVSNGYPYLVGVEFEMEATRLDQQFGRVKCYSLIKYKELAALHSSAPIIPPYMACFSEVREMIFSFNVIDPVNVHHLKAALNGFAESLIANGMPPPFEIMKQYDAQLLMGGRSPGELEGRELWVAYLEFIVISALIDGAGIADIDYITGIEKKRRLLYTSDNSNWIGRLDEVLRIARKLLDKNGTLIIASPDAAAKPFPPGFLLKNVINNIATVPSQGPFSISEVESSIYTSYKLTHLEGLRTRCVIDNEYEYRGLAPGRDQLQMFRDKLNEIIT
ncbi:ABC-three component system protein [Pseudomonas sp. KnCO4]|uniref:ABC-three component system protein n=1 Tax=Pseudomonas sp. KnCO4 TaxID=3381355 RepID=UPI003877CC4A